MLKTTNYRLNIYNAVGSYKGTYGTLQHQVWSPDTNEQRPSFRLNTPLFSVELTRYQFFAMLHCARKNMVAGERIVVERRTS